MSLPANFIARPYRGLSVQKWEGKLQQNTVRRTLLGREAYRRTEFLALRSGAGTALLRLRKASEEPLFSPIVEVDWLAGPHECTFLDLPEVDTGNASAMAQAALASGQKRRVYVIEGLYHHVNFIHEPRPIRVQVVEVVPPEPPKLLEMAQKVISFDEDLPPIELVFEPIDIRQIAKHNSAARYLLPCRGSGIDLPAPVEFLDERPAQHDWMLIGCERSRQFYEWFYKSQPRRVELCPRRLASPGGPQLIKCCLLERGLEREGARIVVPWGAYLTEVQRALRELAVIAEPDSRSLLTSTLNAPSD